MTNPNVFQIMENGSIHQLRAVIAKLKKEGNSEVLYTTCGQRILLDNLISMNGVSWG